MKSKKLGDIFLNKAWPLILCCIPLLMIFLVLVRANVVSPSPDLDEYTLHFDTKYEMLQAMDEVCELLLLECDEYLDFNAALYFEPGKYEDSSRWRNLIVTYVPTDENVSEITFEAFFQAYPEQIPKPEKGDVITEAVCYDTTYYLIDTWNEPDGKVSNVEAIVFSRHEIVYILQTVSLPGSEKDIWYYYERIC